MEYGRRSHDQFSPYKSGPGRFSLERMNQFSTKAMMALAFTGAFGHESLAQDARVDSVERVESIKTPPDIDSLAGEVRSLRSDLEGYKTLESHFSDIDREQRVAEMETIMNALSRFEAQLKEIKAGQEAGVWDWIERYEFSISILVLTIGGVTLSRILWVSLLRHYPILSIAFNAPCKFEDKQARDEVKPKDRILLRDPSTVENPPDYEKALWTFLIDLQELEDLNFFDRRRLQKSTSKSRNNRIIEKLPEEVKALFGHQRGGPGIDFSGDYTCPEWLAERGRDFLPLHKDTSALIRRLISISYGDDAKEKEQGLETFDPNTDRRRIYFSLRDDRSSERKHFRALILPEDRFKYLPTLEEVELCWVRSEKFRKGRLIDLILMKNAVLKAKENGGMDMQPFVWSHDIPPKTNPKSIKVEL